MHDIRAIRENPALYDAAWARRGIAPHAQKIVEVDAKMRAATTAKQEAEAQRNAASKAIGQAKAQKNNAEAERLMLQVAALKARIEQVGAEEAKWQAERDGLLAALPNAPAADVPDGADESANIELRRWYKSDGGDPPALDLTADHVALGEALGMMDFEAAARLSGARFVALKGALARLERALASFMLDLHTTEYGYTEVSPPLLVKDHAMFGTGQLPKFVDDQFTAARTVSREELLFQALERFDEEFDKRRGQARPTEVMKELLEVAPTREDFWLIPTAEVALTNLVREQILDEAMLPIRLTADTLLRTASRPIAMTRRSPIAGARSEAIWAATKTLPVFQPLTSDLTADVCIVGAGIAGLLTAYELSQAGNHLHRFRHPRQIGTDVDGVGDYQEGARGPERPDRVTSPNDAREPFTRNQTQSRAHQLNRGHQRKREEHSPQLRESK